MKKETKKTIEKAYSKELIKRLGYEFLETMLPLQSFEDACKIEKLDPVKVVPDFSNFPEEDQESMDAHARIVIIIKAANRLANNGKPWKADFSNNEWKYQPIFYYDAGSSGFRSGDDVGWITYSFVGSRRCFISHPVMYYIVNEFIDLYNKDML